MIADSDREEPKTTIKEHENALSPGTDPAEVHFNRAIDWLRLSEWEKAREDLTSASERGFDIAAVFLSLYKSAGTFEDDFGVELPADIADIVDPISEEEDAALVKAIEEGLESELVSEECVMAILRGEDAG